MNDKPEEFEDDFLDLDDDDLEFEDDLLDEESWNDFDDEGTPAAAEDVQFVEDTAPAPVKQKSFLSKNFNAIVITIAVIGAGGWFLMNMASDPPKTQSAMPQADNAQISGNAPNENTLATAEGMPPMPAPIEAVENQEALSAPENVADILTPMPDFAEAHPAPEPEATVEPESEEYSALPVIGTAPDLGDDDIGDMPAAPVEPVESLDTIQPLDDLPITQETEPAAATEEMIAEQPAQTVDLPEATAPETPIESTAPAVAAEEMTALENRLSDLESANDDLSAQMVETKESLSDLSASVNALKASIDKLTSNPPVAKAPEKTASPAPKPKQTQATTPAPQPAKQAAPKTQTTNVKWSLKAAQPGKAIIAAQGGNIMNVKTGDVVPGLGKITSIEMKNGLWTVTGTQGSVSQ